MPTHLEFQHSLTFIRDPIGIWEGLAGVTGTLCNFLFHWLEPSSSGMQH